jgi:hypothetical protein
VDPATTVTVTLPGEDGTSTTTLIGPSGTAPGMNFVTPADRPVDDSSAGRVHTLPLLLAALFVVVLLTVVVVRSRRARTVR